MKSAATRKWIPQPESYRGCVNTIGIRAFVRILIHQSACCHLPAKHFVREKTNIISFSGKE